MPSYSADNNAPQPQQTMEMVTPQDAIVSQQPVRRLAFPCLSLQTG